MYFFWLYFDKDKNEIRLGFPPKEDEIVFSHEVSQEKTIKILEDFFPGDYWFALRKLGKDARYKEIMTRLLKEQGIEEPFAYTGARGFGVPGPQKSKEGVWLNTALLHFPDQTILKVQLFWDQEKNDYGLRILERTTTEEWESDPEQSPFVIALKDRVLEQEIKEWEKKTGAKISFEPKKGVIRKKKKFPKSSSRLLNRSKT